MLLGAFAAFGLLAGGWRTLSLSPFVDVVVCGYIVFIEYNIVLDSDGSFLWPVYLIALRL